MLGDDSLYLMSEIFVRSRYLLQNDVTIHVNYSLKGATFIFTITLANAGAVLCCSRAVFLASVVVLLLQLLMQFIFECNSKRVSKSAHICQSWFYGSCI